jgi:hypothetical protein
MEFPRVWYAAFTWNFTGVNVVESWHFKASLYMMINLNLLECCPIGKYMIRMLAVYI